MKKFVLFAVLVCAVSSFSLGCASTSDWCKRGSWSPFSRPAVSEAPIYYAPASTSYAMPACCDPCATVDPCGAGSVPFSDPGPQGGVYIQ